MPFHKYQPFASIPLSTRVWPTRTIDKAPLFASVDLRDGNQALAEPMGLERKLRLFNELVRMGFKEIEVGFPAASQPDFDFTRHIIEHGLIPDDVTIQVLTQARAELIERSFEAIRGARRAIVHLYNSTSTLQRRVVFALDREGIMRIAVEGTKLIKELAKSVPETEVVLQYSPESFTGTELDFAKEICDRVTETWGASPARKVIINLPATVEMAMPNVYADQIEWMHTHLARRDSVVLSVHPHNDRGTAVAAAELAVLAGAERIEGTLFGNGERTGNVCVVTLAMNLFSQGIDPTLDLSNIDALKRLVEHVNRLPVHPRHPYAGELVYTAFSGSHQDAIKKGLTALRTSQSAIWEVPYLPIDPADVGRTYEAVIRVNSQSGKSGVAYVLEEDHGYALPKELAIDFAKFVQQRAEETEREVTSHVIYELFTNEYMRDAGSLKVHSHGAADDGAHSFAIELDGAHHQAFARGHGPIEAFIEMLALRLKRSLSVQHYVEHALGEGADARAVSYVCVRDHEGATRWGVGEHQNIVLASLRAIASAIERMPWRRTAQREAAAE